MLTITRDIGLVSFLGNPMVLVVTTNNHLDQGVPRPFYSIFCHIYLTDPAEEGAPFFTDSMQPSADGVVRFDISAVLRSKAKPTITHPFTVNTKEIKDAGATLTFWLQFSEGYGIPFAEQEAEITSDAYYGIPGGLSDAMLAAMETNSSNVYAFLSENKIFLTSQPERKKVLAGQTEMVRYFNFEEENVGAKLMLREYDMNNAATVREVYESTLDALSLYDFNITPGLAFTLASTTSWWELFLIDSVTDEPISETISFSLCDMVPTNPRQIFIQNSLGGFDSITSTGNRSLIYEGEASSGFIAHSGNTSKWLEPTEDRRQSKRIYKGVLGFFSSEELHWIMEFFNSGNRYIVDNGNLERLILRQTEFPGDTDSLPGVVEIEAEIGAPNAFFFRRKRKLTFPLIDPNLGLRLLTEDEVPILTENSKFILIEL